MTAPVQLVAMLRGEREELATALVPLCNRDGYPRGDLSAERRDQFDAASARLDVIDARLVELGEKERRSVEAENAFRTLVDTPRRQGRGASTLTGQDRDLDAAFRSAILERNPRPIDAHWESPRSYFQPGVERRDLLTSAPANMMPVSFFGRLVEHLVETSAVLRAGATLVTTESGEPLRVPRSTGLSAAGIVAEAAVIPESDPALGIVTLGAFKYGILMQVSTEMVEDAGFDLLGYLARQSGVALGNALGNHLINGTGTGQPRGVLLDATVGQTGPVGTATSFGAQGTAGQGTDLLLDLHSSVIEPYSRSRAAGWLLRSATLNTIRKLKTTTAGELVGAGGTGFVEPAPAGSQASAGMVGAPAYIDPFVPAMAASAKSVIFGDWSRFFVRMVNGVRFERSDDFAFDRDMATFRALIRADGALIDNTGAVKVFAHGAS